MEIFPVWKDLFFEYQGDVLEYRITIKDGDEIFHGRAVKSPKDRVIRIRLNDCCESFLNSLLGEEAFREAESIDRVFPLDAYEEFALDVIEGDSWETAYEWAFTNDYSYEYKEPQGSYSEPINGHCATGQMLPYSHLVTGDTESVCYDGCGGIYFTITYGNGERKTFSGGNWVIGYSTNLSSVYYDFNNGASTGWNSSLSITFSLPSNSTDFDKSYNVKFYTQPGGQLLGIAYASVATQNEPEPVSRSINITAPSTVSSATTSLTYDLTINQSDYVTIKFYSGATEQGPWNELSSTTVSMVTGTQSINYNIPENSGYTFVYWKVDAAYYNYPTINASAVVRQLPENIVDVYLTLEAIDNVNLCVHYAGSTGGTLFQAEYSTDGGSTWGYIPTFANNDTPQYVTIPAGSWVMIRGDRSEYPNWWNELNPSNPSQFVGGYTFNKTTGRFNISGNILSLVFGGSDTFVDSVPAHAFRNLFSGTSVVSAENLVLPSNSVREGGYEYMFYACSSLVKAPKLPANTLYDQSYFHMFHGCSSLVNAPELPAWNLGNRCYQYMFVDCTSLTNPPVLSVTTLKYGCYLGMFKGCTSLVNAPELPATTLAEICYEYMFQDCTSLAFVKCLATDTSARHCTVLWLDGVSATGTFTKAAGMSGWTIGNGGIPSGWTVVDAD